MVKKLYPEWRIMTICGGVYCENSKSRGVYDNITPGGVYGDNITLGGLYRDSTIFHLEG
jgi:hypothetical protein